MVYFDKKIETRSDILQGQALFRGVKRKEEKKKKRREEKKKKRKRENGGYLLIGALELKVLF